MADPSDIADFLRHTSFTASRQRIDELAALSWDGVVEAIVDHACPPAVGSVELKNIYGTSDEEDFEALVDYEVNRISQPDSGLGDKMLWFWHGLITRLMPNVLPALLFRQHQLLAKHALGNFRTMLAEILTDCAMLSCQDGESSVTQAAGDRGAIELFALGRGNFAESDVEARRKALAGWYVKGLPRGEGQAFDPSQIVSRFDCGSAFSGDVTYLGARLHLYGTRSQYWLIVERMLNLQSANGLSICAQRIVSKLCDYLLGSAPDPSTVASLAAIFQDSNFDIRPVLSALFRQADSSRQIPARSLVERPIETSPTASDICGVEGIGPRPGNTHDQGAIMLGV